MPDTKPPINSPALPRAELLWQSLTDSVDCFVMVLGPDHKVQFINRVEPGLTVAETIGRDVTDFIAPEHVPAVRLSLDEVFSKGQTVAYEVQGKDSLGNPSAYAVRISPVFDAGVVMAAVSTAMDTRRLHAVEASLRGERHVLRRLLKLQERERQIVSYEIHDGLAQYLAGAVMLLDTYASEVRSGRGTAAQESLGNLEEGLRLVHAAVDESRRLINGLRPPMLDELGVLDAVESLIAETRLEVPTVQFDRPDSIPRLDPNVETSVFRIIQEALSNVRKHAGASRVNVRVGLAGDADISVVVVDDGSGFDVGAVPQERFGLEGIRQRARLFGREAMIASVPGKGTHIEVTLPLYPALVDPAS